MLKETDILHHIYSGFLGKAIGVRLGAPVEPTIWTYERIRDTYGEITGYVRDFTNFAADDDTNGPVYFIRAMRDYQLEPTPQEVAKTWLNYAGDGHGMYWWGGYGRSTEHTAYLNLRAGIEAPRSGSIAQNGAAIAEQIGGQIFIDSWGWVNPGNPHRAADMSARAASVAHDGDGLNGARFVAAAIAAAFTTKDVAEVFAAGLAEVPKGSTYARVAEAVAAFHAAHPHDWRACRAMLDAEWGYDRYPGVCHIIPNAGVLILALLYGAGDLPRTVEIATMCGWDTDCNAGNAGAIVGTLQGVQPNWNKYRKPINDMIVASGVIGTLNVVDVPSFARELTVLALKLDDRPVPALWEEDMTRRGVRFDFTLPGATHGFRTAESNQLSFKWAPAETPSGTGALEVLIDRFERGQTGRLFWKPFYRNTDFDDARYRPMFSPIAAAGQTVTMTLKLDPQVGDGNLRVAPYIRRTQSKTFEELGAYEVPASADWTTISFTIPETDDEAIDEIGLKIEYFGRLKFLGHLNIADFTISGPGHTRIDPANEVEEWEGISRFTWNRGYWKLENGRMTGLTASDADIWTGHGYARDLSVCADIMPLAGASHLITARAQGTARFYAAGFQDGKAVILKEDFGTNLLASTEFAVEPGRDYQLKLRAEGDVLSLSIDGKTRADDEGQQLCLWHVRRAHGLGRTHFGRRHRYRGDSVMSHIELHHTGKSFGSVSVLEDINLNIEQGEFVVLVGPSGCGKSTLLRMVAGLEDISAGDLLINGQIANGIPAKKRDLAMVFQSYALYPHMNVADNMSFALRLARAPKSEIQSRVQAAAEILGLENLLDRLPRELSGGPASARGHGARHRARSAGLPVRRTAQQSRRQAQGAHALRDQEAAQAPGQDDDLRHPRPKPRP